jgi:hypothetical protein
VCVCVLCVCVFVCYSWLLRCLVGLLSAAAYWLIYFIMNASTSCDGGLVRIDALESPYHTPHASPRSCIML